VPGAERAEWSAEWRAELCYVPGNRRTGFCLGAFRDAFWMRRHTQGQIVYLQSPWECLAVLSIAAAVSLFVALHTPRVREVFFPPPYATNLASIHDVSVAEYRALAGGSAFSGVAFYRPIYGPLGQSRDNFLVSLASRNLFEILGVTVAAATAPGVNALIVTDSAWRRRFDHDPHVIGRRLEIAGQPSQVTAIVSDRLWRLPGYPDAWLLLDDTSLHPDLRGVALARAVGAGSSQPEVPVQQFHPVLLVLLLLAAGCAVLPAVTSLSLGEYPANRQRFSRATTMRRWLFLAAKITLVLPISLFGALDFISILAVSLQGQGAILGIVLGLRWALVDQRRRCPICLRVLTHPTRIGQASHTFLELWGTELICTRGHGLLHVPELSNGYTTQRWQHLDSSWSSLFS
jgi:hypothetical protein